MYDVTLPPFLADRYALESVAEIELLAAAALLRVRDGAIVAVPLAETPHYACARALISGEAERGSPHWRSYEEYCAFVAAGSGQPQPDANARFSTLLREIRTHGYAAGAHRGEFILVVRAGARFRILDGLHRATVLKALAHSRVLVGVLRPVGR